MISYLRRSSNYKQALQLLEDAAKRYQSKYPELTPEILYEYALLYDALKDYTKMRDNLEILIKNHAAHKLAAQAFFMLGDMHVRNGDYQQALTLFQQAQERSQGSVLAYACIGRTANTAYALYGKTQQKQYLRQATECYENLLKIKDLPPEFYFQSLYGLGNCLKDSGNQTGALRCYRDVLYNSLLAKREGRFYSVRWCSKSLTAALQLLLPAANKAATPEDRNAILAAAEQLLQIAGKLELPGEDIKQQQEILQRMQSL
jgi:tetratricopeptide (TPR) repeat protein